MQGFLLLSLSILASALLDIHLKLFTLNQLRVFKQNLFKLNDIALRECQRHLFIGTRPFEYRAAGQEASK
jgi:hypothetical protein